MTTINISWKEATKLTPTIKALQELGFEKTQRQASRGEDIVFGLSNRATQFYIEYTVKHVAERNFVNWARLRVNDADAPRFLEMIGYIQPVQTIKHPEL